MTRSDIHKGLIAMKMKFQDHVSYAIHELERGRYPRLRAAAAPEAFTAEAVDLPINVGPAIEILQSLETIHATDMISRTAGGSHEAKRMVSEKLCHVIAKALLREGLVDIEIGDCGPDGYPVRARVRVMKPKD